MSSISDAFSGATSGVSDQTLSDASLGSDITGGGSLADTGSSLYGGTDASSVGGFNSFNDLVNAFSGGGATGSSSNAVQAAAMTPPAAAAATGGDPTGAAGGTQSATSPGSQPVQSQGGGSGTQPNQPQQNQHAPESAVDQLRQLLKGLQGKPTGPTAQVPQPQSPAPFALPTLAAGQTGAQSPMQTSTDVLRNAADQLGATPAAASLPPVTPGETGAPSTAPEPGFSGSEPGGARDITPDTSVNRDAQGNPITAAGTPADQTPTPPPRPTGDQTASTTGGKPTPKTDDQGRQITVQKPGAGAQPDLPTKVPAPLPTKKPGLTPPPAQTYPATTQIQRDIAGISTGSPTALADLAHAAMELAPLIGMFMGGGGGRRGHFRGGRFTHGVGPFRGFGGGMRAMGFHPGGSRPWPYHHPQMGWDMHHRHPGGGWLPMHPRHAAEFGYYPGMGAGLGGTPDPTQQQDPNAPDPNRPPKETGADPGTPDSAGTSGAIPGVSGKQVDDYTREAAKKNGIDPDIASKILGQESSYGQARRPGDGGTSFGPFQLHFAPDGKAMGDDFMRDTGKDPRDPSTWKAQIDYAMKRAAQGGWGPWTTTMKKLGLKQWSGITTNPQFAGKPMSTTQPQNLAPAAAIPTTLPPSSTGMVAGT